MECPPLGASRQLDAMARGRVPIGEAMEPLINNARKRRGVPSRCTASSMSCLRIYETTQVRLASERPAVCTDAAKKEGRLVSVPADVVSSLAQSVGAHAGCPNAQFPRSHAQALSAASRVSVTLTADAAARP